MKAGKYLQKIIGAALIGTMVYVPSIAWAEIHNVTADGEYTLATSDTMEQAKDKALKEAMRSAVEKAGVYIESYSIAKDMSLTQDEVRVIAGSIIKIDGKRFETVADGDSFIVRCYITAEVNTDEINLKRAMETRKAADDNVRLKKSVGELQTENQSLREQYAQAKDDNEKMRIQNELLSNEQALGMLYQNAYQGTAILNEIRSATADIDSIKQAYVGMPAQELRAQIHPALLRDGWSFKDYNGNLVYHRELDGTFRESLAFPGAWKILEMESLSFSTRAKVAADKVYRIAFANLYKALGQPTVTYHAYTSSANWTKLGERGKTNRLTLSEIKYGDFYQVSISKQVWNPQAEVHRAVSQASDIRLNLDRNNGDWYDDAGHKVLSIHDGIINNCPVIAGFDFIGGRGQCGTYRIRQASGPRDIKIERISENTIKVDDRTVLRNTPAEQFFESVNGVHLGMRETAVQQILGSPERKGIGRASRPTWYYDAMGLQIEFDGGKVVQIHMLNNGNWFLQRSGLNYRNSIVDFQSAYHMDRKPSVLTPGQRAEGMIGGAVRIAKGEYLWLDYYPDEITLSIYWN
ncbi:MAG: hypothetical protein SOV43_01470 [Selenomonadaceae bacterium]|nr:hypothetical protein [Selenomonadaceae bacterium]